MFYIYKDMGSIIAALKNKKWRLVNAEIAAFKGVEIVYVRTVYGKELEEAEKPAAEVVIPAAEEIIEEMPEAEETVEKTTEEIEEVPLELSEEETETALMEEGSLDGSREEVEELAAIEDAKEQEQTVDEAEEVAEEEQEPTVDEAEKVAEEEQEPTVEEAEKVSEEEQEPTVEEVKAEKPESEAEEAEKAEESAAPKKEEFKLTAPENAAELMSKMCTKRARKLIYRPNEELFSMTCEVLGTDKNNEEKINVKKILEAEIKEGLKLGYLDKFDGLKGSELKEEYENDTVYELAEQEFKRTGLLFDGKKVKVYIYDWDLKSCHHIGYIADEFAEQVKPYLLDSEKYSFDVIGIITGGKYKKIIKDPETGKITVEKGNDGKLGVELDVTIINRKD